MKHGFRFHGFAAHTDGRVNQNGNRFEHGAFRMLEGQKIPLCWNHRMWFDEEEGLCENVTELDNALFVSGSFMLDDSRDVDRELLGEIESGRIMGLSIGIREWFTTKRNGVWVCTTVESLDEISLCDSPADRSAQVTITRI